MLRGREQFEFEKDTQEFERQLSETWRISLRSLYKRFDIKDLKRWEQEGLNWIERIIQ